MSVSSNLDSNYTPTKEFIVELSKVYTGEKEKFDLTKITANEYKNLLALDENFDKLEHNLTREDIREFLDCFINYIPYHPTDDNIGYIPNLIEEICLFKDLNIVFKFCLYNVNDLKKAIEHIKKKNITFVEDDTTLPVKDLDHFNNRVEKIYDKYVEMLNVGYFQDWRGEDSITAGGLFVELCDYLGLKVKSIDKTPMDWNIQEFVFQEYYTDHNDKHLLKNFARLFSRHPSCWYGEPWWN